MHPGRSQAKAAEQGSKSLVQRTRPRAPAAHPVCAKPLDWGDPVTDVWSLTSRSDFTAFLRNFQLGCRPPCQQTALRMAPHGPANGSSGTFRAAPCRTRPCKSGIRAITGRNPWLVIPPMTNRTHAPTRRDSLPPSHAAPIVRIRNPIPVNGSARDCRVPPILLPGCRQNVKLSLVDRPQPKPHLFAESSDIDRK